jgi:hypothetical protein
VFFHQMMLDRVDDNTDEYVIQNSSIEHGGAVIRIPKTREYYVNQNMMLSNNSAPGDFKFYGPQGEFMWLVNEDFGINETHRPMKQNTWYLLPQAYSMTLIPDKTDLATSQQVYISTNDSDLTEVQINLNSMMKLNSKEVMESWLTGFLKKLKRSSTRTQKCRLLLSVERMEFENHKFAADWQYVRFGKYEAEILDKEKKRLGEKKRITEYQRIILESYESSLDSRALNRGGVFNHESLINAELCRSKIKAETGEWAIQDDLKKISEGGEALVFSQKFGDDETAVRVHIFDPFLLTAKFDSDMVVWKAHFETGLFLLCY